MPSAPSDEPATSPIGLRFTKMSGAGNDFVVLVEPPENLDFVELSRLLCRRGTSIGADGLFTLQRIPSGARMIHYNADGGVAELCLNGTRCAAAMALRLGWTAERHSGRVVIETGAGPVCAEASPEGIRMQVPPPGPVEAVVLEVDQVDLMGSGLPTDPDRPDRLLASTCNTGVPHLVVRVDAEVLATLDLDRFGPPLRAHPDLGPAGANVNFLAASDDLAVLRTFERGVEGETLACGTGAVACAAVLLHGRDGQRVLQTRGGSRLAVQARNDGEGERSWTLEGDARFVFEGTIESGALVDLTAGRL